MNRRRILSITDGLTMPAPVGVRIGSAKSMTASVLFFDLADFTATTSRLDQEQTLNMLNMIIPTMMRIASRWNGEIEKNTGDGIMAIFGTETRDNTSIARDAVEAARESLALSLNPEFMAIIEQARAECRAGKTLSLEEMKRACWTKNEQYKARKWREAYANSIA